MTKTIDRQRALASLLSELFGGEQLGPYTVSDDLSRVQARVWIEDQPYMYVYEIDEASGEYKLRSLNSLGRAKL